MKWAHTLWLSVALAGCISEETSGSDPEPSPDVGATVDGSASGADGGGAELDATVDGALEPDQAVPDAAAPDPCQAACDTLVRCAGELCEAFAAGGADVLQPGCLTACAASPAFATVVNGAGACQTVVDFARDSSPDFAAACAPELPEPEVCRVDVDCADDGTRVCREGFCRPAQFSPCRSNEECDTPSQACINASENPLDPGVCHITCAAEGDAACPINQECVEAFDNVCYYALCGAGYTNGPVFGTCAVGDREGGTCYPLPEGNRTAAGLPGVCIDGGDAPVGAPCDAQAVGFTDADRALRCDQSVCFGDPDDPNDPDALMDGTGTCATICDPRAPDCGEASVCLDFSNGDDPATPMYDDTRFIGVCAATDCSVLADATEQCGEGRGCAVYAVTSDAGICADSGQRAPGEACERWAECAGSGVCGEDGTCITPCRPGADPVECPEGHICFVGDETWAIGFCFQPPPAP